MGEARNKVERDKWVADFETTTDLDDCRVWAWGACFMDSPDNTFTHGNDIEQFMKWVDDKPIVYFHNLAFDGAFILDWLLNRNYKHVEDRKLNFYTFTTLISNMGKFYSIRVRWGSGHITEFRDSLKKLPISVSAMAEAFKLEESKEEIDYHAPRAKGHVLTAEEISYLRSDVVIVAKALKHQFDEGLDRLTMGSDSLHSYKEHLTPKVFATTFPTLAYSVDSDIRRSYKGGFTKLMDGYAGKRVGKGVIYDVNSLYPSVMMYDDLPYGEPVYTEDHLYDDPPMCVMAMSIVAKLKPNHIPCIPIKSGMFVATQYHVDDPDVLDVCCTSVDWKLWNEHYDIEVLAFYAAWVFKPCQGIFTEWIDHWREVKENSVGAMRFIAKLQLNNLYGKFATNPNVTGKYPYLDEDMVVRYRLGTENVRDPVYTPMGSFITAYARAKTIRAAQANYPRFIYADTDSLHLTGTDPAILDEVHDSKFGAWALEAEFDDAIYIRPKSYGNFFDRWCPDKKCDRRMTKHTHTHVAGLPVSLQKELTLSDFENGRTLTGKLLPKRVRGGIVLVETEFRLESATI